MSRTRILLILIFLVFASALPASADTPGTWTYYRDHFISRDGRVIDYYQDKISHSEGQGYGMILSVKQGDRSTFDRILSWTRNNLMVRRDCLSAWSWGRFSFGEWHVIDYNTATDGDLLIAWALLEAGDVWKDPDLAEAGMNIAETIQTRVVVSWNDKKILMPGYYGFTRKNGLIVNPSYFIFPALDLLAQKDPSGNWTAISETCTALTRQAAMGRLGLVPDWGELDAEGQLSVHILKSRFFGYDAIRVPLYLAMAGKIEDLKIFSGYLGLYRRMGYLPSRVDLVEDLVSLDEAPAGFYAVAARAAQLVGDLEAGAKMMKRAEEKIRSEKDDYYSNTLYLLALTMVTP